MQSDRQSDRGAYSVETRCASTRRWRIGLFTASSLDDDVAARPPSACAAHPLAAKVGRRPCDEASARGFARTRRTSSRVRVGIGFAIGLGFRRVLLGLLLRLFDRRVRPRRVCFGNAALDVYCRIRVDRRFDARAPVAACARDRRLDGNLVLRIILTGRHRIDPVCPGRGPVTRLVQASCQDGAPCARQPRAGIATFLQTICRLLQYRLQVVPPCVRSKSALSSEGDAGTALATECAQGVGNIGFVQPSHEPSSIHPARLLHFQWRPCASRGFGDAARVRIGPDTRERGATV